MGKASAYHHGDLRAELVRVATEKLINEGPEALTLRGLSAQLNVSRTAPYRHFKDKNELMCAIAREGFRLFALSLQQAWEHHAQLGTVERFKAVGQAYIHFSLDNPAHYQLMFGTSELLRNPNDSLKAEADGSFLQLRKILEYGQQQGVFTLEDSLLQARFVWSSMHGYCSIVAAQEEAKSKSMLEESAYFIDKIVDAIKAK